MYLGRCTIAPQYAIYMVTQCLHDPSRTSSHIKLARPLWGVADGRELS